MRRLSALFVFLSFVVSAQNEPPKFEGPFSFISLPEGDGFKIITSSKVYYTQDGINFTTREHNFQLDVHEFNLFPGTDNILVHRGGGLVYQYENDSLVRLDKSYMWRSRFNSASLLKNDTIALIGGFGEYNEAKNIVYYDDYLREWFEYKIKLEQFEDTILYAQYDSISDKLIGISTDWVSYKYFEYEFQKGLFKDVSLKASFISDYFPVVNFPEPLLLSDNDIVVKWNLEEKTYSLYRFDKELKNEKFFLNYNSVSKTFLVYNNKRKELMIVDEDLLFS